MASLLDTVEDPGDLPNKYDVGIFGGPGSGKTTLLATALRRTVGRGLVLYTPRKEGYSGIGVLKRWRERIKFKPIDDFDEYYKWFKALRDDNPKLPPKLHFDWVAHDTFTGGVQLCIQKVLSKRPKEVHGKIKISGDEWGAIAGLLDTDLVQPYKSLPISTIWLMQEKDKRGRRKHGRLGPDVTPGAVAALSPAVLYMGRLYVKQDEEGNSERWLRIGAHDSMATKYRSFHDDYVPDVIKRPHITKLVEFLYEGGDCPFEEAIDIETEEEDDNDGEVVSLKRKSASTDDDTDPDDDQDE